MKDTLLEVRRSPFQNTEDLRVEVTVQRSKWKVQRLQLVLNVLYHLDGNYILPEKMA